MKFSKNKWKYIVVSVVFLTVISFSLFNLFWNNLNIYADDLMAGITPNKIQPTELNDEFVKATSDFSIELFKNNIHEDKNTLVSPVSVYLALGMTANGSANNTLAEFEKTLGNNIKIDDLNKYYHSLISKLESVNDVKLNIANSIWYGHTLPDINKNFLQTNADYFGANAYKCDFSSPKALEDINNWVKKNTDNEIDKILDKIPDAAIMYLINTILFDAEWHDIYKETQIYKDKFFVENNDNINIEFMDSDEHSYLCDESTTGFIKPYKNNKFSFAALLPNENIDIDTYIDTLTGEKFLNLLNNKESKSVLTSLPKFKYKDKFELSESLKSMGIVDAFGDNADFSKMSSTSAYISRVLHNTFIEVDEKGTKAGAATVVEMLKNAIKNETVVRLDRPFVYAIIDNESELPLFIGAVRNPTIN